MLLYNVQVGNWIELPVHRRLCPIFCLIMDPGEWDTRRGIRLHDIHKFPWVDA